METSKTIAAQTWTAIVFYKDLLTRMVILLEKWALILFKTGARFYCGDEYALFLEEIIDGKTMDKGGDCTGVFFC